MNIRTILLGILLAASLPAAGDFVLIAPAYEIKLSNFIVPVTSTGTVTFRQCDECEPQVVRMTRDTVFKVNGQPVNIKEFREIVFQVKDRSRETIIVKHHLQSDTIVYVSVNI